MQPHNAIDSIFKMSNVSTPLPCNRCGCLNRDDEVGDRVCWCDACWQGCCSREENEDAAAALAGLEDDSCEHGDDHSEYDCSHDEHRDDCAGCFPGCFGCRDDFDPADPWGDGAPEEHPGHPAYDEDY
jgi:hypothetical protein